jgi:hypothetical protein
MARNPNPITIAELLRSAALWDAEFSLLSPMPATKLSVGKGSLTFDKSRVPMERATRARLFAQIKAPEAYLSQRSIDVQSVILDEHIRQGAFGKAPRPVLRNGYLHTLKSDDLVELTHAELINSVAEGLGREGDDLNVSGVDMGSDRLSIELVSEAKQIEIRPGDVVKAGLHIEHSRYCGEATQIHAYVYRLICSNGMQRRECVSAEGIVRTRRLPATHPKAKELLLDQVRRLTTHTWQNLEAQLVELQATNGREADVPKLLGQWVQRARISSRVTDAEEPRTMMDRLLRAWRDAGSESTYYGAVNALTWVGTHDLGLTPRQRQVLSMLGGMLAFSGVHICPRCFSVVSDPRQTQNAHTSEAELAIVDRIPRAIESVAG